MLIYLNRLQNYYKSSGLPNLNGWKCWKSLLLSDWGRLSGRATLLFLNTESQCLYRLYDGGSGCCTGNDDAATSKVDIDTFSTWQVTYGTDYACAAMVALHAGDNQSLHCGLLLMARGIRTCRCIAAVTIVTRRFATTLRFTHAADESICKQY